jgi:hypothetical protein
MSGYLQLIPRALVKFPVLFQRMGLKEANQIISVENGNTFLSANQGRKSVYNTIIIIKDRISRYLDNIALRYVYIELNGLIQKAMGKVYDNEVYKLNNGYLSTVTLGPQTLIPQFVDNLIALNSRLEDNQIELLYIQAPVKLSKFDNQLPVDIKDYSNEDCDVFLELTNKAGIDSIDLRQMMHDEGMDHYGMFFKTDLHWKPETGLWAAGKVSEYLNKNYGFEIDPLLYEPGNYDYEVYKECMLGSQGRRVGILFAGLDDLTIITPRFFTEFFQKKSTGELFSVGNFKETFLDLGMIHPDNLYIYSGYDTYTDVNFPISTIQNNSSNDKKILIVRDSFALVFMPFMALGCSTVDTIQLGEYTGGSLVSYIDQTKPDLVMFLYTNSYGNPELFSFE